MTSRPLQGTVVDGHYINRQARLSRSSRVASEGVRAGDHWLGLRPVSPCAGGSFPFPPYELTDRHFLVAARGRRPWIGIQETREPIPPGAHPAAPCPGSATGDRRCGTITRQTSRDTSPPPGRL